MGDSSQGWGPGVPCAAAGSLTGWKASLSGSSVGQSLIPGSLVGLLGLFQQSGWFLIGQLGQSELSSTFLKVPLCGALFV